MKKKDIKDYIRKQVEKELDERLHKFTIDYTPLDMNLIRIAGADYKVPVSNFKFTIDNHLDDNGVPIMPQDRKLSFVVKSKKNGVDEYLTFTGCEFTSYNKDVGHVAWSDTFVGTAIPARHGLLPKSKKRKTRPKFTPAQRKAMK